MLIKITLAIIIPGGLVLLAIEFARWWLEDDNRQVSTTNTAAKPRLVSHGSTTG